MVGISNQSVPESWPLSLPLDLPLIYRGDVGCSNNRDGHRIGLIVPVTRFTLKSITRWTATVGFIVTEYD